ncbi:hypothetical protein THSYN_13095 [Candidatus Thiodictyon syntrophicum]|uniref:ORC1/DEAH AAA+ ATPase domain-containing protein n=1 Tax=Candidatus Thiodictyon syntrophicum TaxID=1166950 RepID=A0A2K8U8B0_9GAMM|nr:hypothetical protein THSYN_13095 [Candidatus Thiodictyon syntrophicum]
MPIAGFAFLPQADSAEMAQWGLGLCLALAVGALAGSFLNERTGIARRRSRRDQRIAAESQTYWLWFPWALYLPLTVAAYWLGPTIAGLDAKLDEIAIYCALAPVVLTGLPAWPFAALVALRQFRPAGVGGAALRGPDWLGGTLPFRWQTCAFPLPGLGDWLLRLGRERGGSAALEAIQQIQFGTLQFAAARRAARLLANEPQTALPFCGAVAVGTNALTLACLKPSGPAACAVTALLAGPWRDVMFQSAMPDAYVLARLSAQGAPLLLDIGHRRAWPLALAGLFGLARNPRPSYGEPTLQSILMQPLDRRIEYALKRLGTLSDYAQCREFRELCDCLALLAPPIELRQWSGATMSMLTRPNDWLAGGWRLVHDLTGALDSLAQDYRALTSPVARRRLLESRAERVRQLAWDGLPDYWKGIGSELAAHWISLLEAEARQAREWLNLAIEAPAVRFVRGDQRLKLRVCNRSAEPARSVRVTLDPTADIVWVHDHARLDLLEGGKEADLGLDFQAASEGAVRIAGRLDAEDLDGNPFALPFAFQIEIARAGRPYRTPDYQPYVTGEGLGSDRVFVGRADLIDWLRGLWLQPDGKPAVVLVGQRRIGKTSLLNKLARDGLSGTGLLPVAINIQGAGSEYDFLSEAAGGMARLLGQSAPELDRAEPYAAFKSFLQGARGPLGPRRFLLMLDEADLIPERRLGDLLPGFLRALMQEPQYPTVLLFCGTTRLKAMGRDYFSILFNTAQFRTVSYLSAGESAEVLEKPARGILEYDPAVLADGYRLTRGQPLLLQLIGANLINAFNEQVRRGEERSDYVDTNDFDRAVKSVVEQETNAAFENHWDDSDPATHRVLAALAWATDETNRRQLDIDGIESAMAETRLSQPREQTFRCLERLADDEVLERDGPTYRFWVPLYRRWVAWRWPPGRVRDEVAG